MKGAQWADKAKKAKKPNKPLTGPTAKKGRQADARPRYLEGHQEVAELRAILAAVREHVDAVAGEGDGARGHRSRRRARRINADAAS